jgi:hypothetical protein
LLRGNNAIVASEHDQTFRRNKCTTRPEEEQDWFGHVVLFRLPYIRLFCLFVSFGRSFARLPRKMRLTCCIGKHFSTWSHFSCLTHFPAEFGVSIILITIDLLLVSARFSGD